MNSHILAAARTQMIKLLFAVMGLIAPALVAVAYLDFNPALPEERLDRQNAELVLTSCGIAASQSVISLMRGSGMAKKPSAATWP
jgi:hypothetical protein